MNYKKIYNQLIENAKKRNLTKKNKDLGIENHHIIPKCMGGLNGKENLDGSLE